MIFVVVVVVVFKYLGMSRSERCDDIFMMLC